MKFLSFLLVLATESLAMKENDYCDLLNGGKGLIRSASRCKFIHNLITNNETQEAFKLRLGYEGESQVYCCPVRRSVHECKKFGIGPGKYSDTSMRIVGGELADLTEFPHFAALGFVVNDDLKFKSGGSLISDRFVITAAHCCGKEEKVPVIVRLGKVWEWKMIHSR
jgi:Trypsin